jgi:hypothetical protein
MASLRISGEEFAAVVAAGEVHERTVESGQLVLLVDGDHLPDLLPEASMETLATLAAVVVGVIAEPSLRRPDWADVVVAPESTDLWSVVAAIDQHPMAATTLAILLRTGAGRSIGEGLAAESLAYGVLQSGPEFAAWRGAHPAKTRSEEREPPVLVSREGDSLSITLHRPDLLNAFNAAMRDELLAALAIVEVDPSITAVSVRGSGNSFCSGGDLDEFGSRPDPVSAHLVRLQRNVGRAIARVADRVTVFPHGSTVGSGIELAAFADQVVAHPSTLISLPEVHLGLIPGAGGTVSLPRRIGRHATMLLALGRSTIDAETALAWGLVDQIEG